MISDKKIQQHSWGFGYSAKVRMAKPGSIEEAIEVLNYAQKNALQVALAGGANSFGDVFFAEGNIAMDVSGIGGIKEFDTTRGIITVGGGTRVKDILTTAMPAGWFLHGVSGSIDNTVAGALAADVHGKDSWKHGNFSNTVLALNLLTANGNIVEAGPAVNKELFNAVAGGLGLVGVITEVTLQLTAIDSLFVKQVSYKANNLPEVYKLLYPDTRENFDFVFAFTDGFAHGANTGRSIIETGKFVATDMANAREIFLRDFTPVTKIALLKPETFWKWMKPVWEPACLRIFNTLKFSIAGTATAGKMVPYPLFNFPWAKMPGASHSFYPHGFREFQAAFDKKVATEAIAELLAVCRKFNRYPILSSIKRHTTSSGYLSFSAEGLSVTINFLLKNFTPRELHLYTHALIEVTAKYNGVVYLAKFADLPRDVFQAMYPAHKLFTEQKKIYDPGMVFYSNTAHKLFAW